MKKALLFSLAFSLFLQGTLLAQADPKPDAKPDVKTDAKPDAKSGTNSAPAKSDSEAKITVTAEVVTDFIWRGMSFAGEFQSRRNSSSYKGANFAPALQPTIDFQTPLKGFSIQLWGSFQLTDRSDVDSDKRFLQSYPGGPGPAYIGQRTPADPCVDSLANGIGSVDQNCAPNQALGLGVQPYNEQNGLKRSDGLFYSFLYTFDKARFGSFTTGMWFYNTFHKAPAYVISFPGDSRSYPARLAWQEYFLTWKLPFLEVVNPAVSFYTQVSQENFGLFAGKNYLSLALGREIEVSKLVKVAPAVNIGYAMSNNNFDNRNGLQDVTTDLKVFVGDFFVKLSYIYRPLAYLYDTDNYFGTLDGIANRTSKDGMVADPSRVNGAVNQYAMDIIERYFPNPNDPAALYLKEKWTLQKIPKHLFYASIGYSYSF